MNDKIYLPINDVNEFKCYVIQDKDTIRAYKTTPTRGGNSAYTDFYINSHYLSKDSVTNQTWSTNATLPVCVNVSRVTNDYYYRNDFDSILIIFIIMFYFIFLIPFKIVGRVFGRWLKV